MNIKLKFTPKIKKEAGISSEFIEIEQGTALQKCLRDLAERHNEGFKQILFKADGEYRNSVLLAINNQQVKYSDNKVLNTGDELMIMSPIAGG